MSALKDVAALASAARGHAAAGDTPTAVYVAARSWPVQEPGDPVRAVTLLRAKCSPMLARKPGLAVAYDLASYETEGFDYDFANLMDLVVDRRVRCVVVPSIFHMADNSQLAYQAVCEVFAPGGVRFVDCSHRFDSATCDLGAYIARVKEKCRNVACHRDAPSSKGEAGVYKQSVPYGYVYDKSARGWAAVDPATAPHVAAIFEMAKADKPLADIARAMDAAGAPTPAARKAELYGMSARSSEGWTVPMVRNIISNRFYAGDLPLSRRRASEGGYNERLEDGEQRFARNHHEALVSKRDFAAVRRLREKRQEQKGWKKGRKRG